MKPAKAKKATAKNNKTTSTTSGNSMWGGHYSIPPGELMQKINVSIGFDKKLYRQDIAGSRAHCAMLSSKGIIPKKDADAILKGLDKVLAEIEAGDFPFRESLEDIHMNVEARLKEIVGDSAGKLHTARSRNDQVATDFRLFVRDALDALDAELKTLQKALLDKAEKYSATIMPGFTHLQIAQPVTFGHHLLAYVEMAGRDRSRIKDARARMNECPLGAAALAGTSFPIDRHATAKNLGFSAPTANSIDSVSDRDFALEFLFIASNTATHLSRLAEELVLWASDGFKFVKLSESFTTGSSIMPQKRNPDAAELVRAKVGRINGALITLLTVMKGLPLTYSKDMQEDKECTFDAFESVMICVQATSGMVKDLTANENAMKAMSMRGYSTATDLADWLVRTLGLPFRECHHITGRIVKLAEGKDCRLDELSLKEMQGVEKRITNDIFNVLSVEKSVASRVSFGGTAPANVKKSVAAARKKFL